MMGRDGGREMRLGRRRNFEEVFLSLERGIDKKLVISRSIIPSEPWELADSLRPRSELLEGLETFR